MDKKMSPSINGRYQDNLIVGRSPAIAGMLADIQNAAPYNVNILTSGPTGAGKELVAQTVHAKSKRNGALVSVNCAAIPRDLLEAELFGHEKGAFTGAASRRVGRFEEADGGTLFLDEIGDMPLDLQTKLLRVLETRAISRIGSNKETAVDFRLVCATHQDLKAKTARGLFRGDLMFRLSVIEIRVPPLKDRLSDIPELLSKMAEQMENDGTGLIAPEMTQAGLDELMRYDWPGNVRELKNFFQRAAVLSRGEPIDNAWVRRLLFGEIKLVDEQEQIWNAIQVLPRSEQVSSCDLMSEATDGLSVSRDAIRAFLENKAVFSVKDHLASQEKDTIEIALDLADNNVSRAAQHLDLKRTTLTAKMRKYGIGCDASVDD
ncbi:sigma-54 interaction domain-containing protein [Thalassobacter stenotrophicus]|nr:sigma-54 dependent transcriptional regulator [Thalassobacter stenotrophicus]